MLTFDLTLETDSVLIRPIEPEDYPNFLELTGEENLWKFFTSDLSKPDELKIWIDTALNQRLNKTRLAFTIIDKSENRISGSTSLGNISYRDVRIEIGWTWLGSMFQGKGINDAVKKLLLKHCFEDQKFERVECKTDVLNIPARKALERIGFVEEGILRSHTLMTHNRRRDTIFYSILREEWDKIKA